MLKTIEAAFGNNITVIPAEGDTTTTIAHLVVFTKFDTRLARLSDTRSHCIAYDAIQEDWQFEFLGGDLDFYDGFTARFADGSALRVNV